MRADLDSLPPRRRPAAWSGRALVATASTLALALSAAPSRGAAPAQPPPPLQNELASRPAPPSQSAAPLQSAVPSPSAAQIMPLTEVHAGMSGIGLTVVRGSEPEAFDFEVLGVLKDTFPGQSLIVVRLAGLGLEDVGVAAGMSGSPLYIDGRLIGAVAYRLGAFAKEPLAGVTPIETMLRVREVEAARGAAAAQVPSGARLVDAAATLLDGRTADLGGLRSVASEGVYPIATPVTIGGVDPEVVHRVSPLFEAMGWRPSIGGTAQGSVPPTTLRPGSTVAAQLVRGDITFTATGTVTWVGEDSMLAFGHPFLQAGNTDFPFAPAQVLAVVPSLSDSQKLTVTGDETLGSIRQDRQAGILGILGAAPAMVPVRLTVASGGNTERFDFEMVADKSLSPAFLFIALATGLQSVGSLSGDTAVEVRGELRLAGDYPPVRLENLYSSSAQAFMPMASTISAIYGYLYDNPFAPVAVNGVDLDITLRDDRRVAEIARVWTDRAEVRAGETIRLDVWLQPYRQAEVKVEVDLALPDDLPAGPLTVLVGDAEVVAEEEAGFVEGGMAPQNVEQLVTLINRGRPSDRVYYQLSRPDEGAFYGGRVRPSLPPSILEVLRNDRTSGEVSAMHRAVVLEGSAPVAFVVTGEHKIELNVRRR